MDDSSGDGKSFGTKEDRQILAGSENHFECREIAGQMRVNIASFENGMRTK